MPFRITVKQNRSAVEFEVGSMKEAIAVLEVEGDTMTKAFALVTDIVNAAAAAESVTGAQTVHVPSDATTAAAAEEGKRKRRTKAEMEAARNASAPPPMPVPTVPVPVVAPPPVPTVPVDGEAIPAFLRVPVAPTAAAPPPPPPPLAVAPPVVPAAVPINIGLGANEVIAELKRRSAGDAAAEQACADWVTSHKDATGAAAICSTGAKFGEVLDILRFTKNEALAQLAAELSITIA